MAHDYATWPATGHEKAPCAVHAQARQEARPGRLAALTAAERVEEAGRQAADERAAEVEGSRVTAAPGSLAHREYVRWRARQIAYGRWNPWADAAPAREHVRLLRRAGASDRAIAQAAGVSTMTVYRLQHGESAKGRPVPGRIRAAHAQQLLAVTTARVQHAAARRDAAGTRRRLQALIAVGHPAASLASCAGLPPRVVWGIVRGTTATVSRDMHDRVCVLYEKAWDLRPPERTAAQRRAAAAARRRAASQGWPAPMGLDDDQIDDPAYRPRARWRPVSGAGVPWSPGQPARTADPRSGGDQRRDLGQDPGLEAVS